MPDETPKVQMPDWLDEWNRSRTKSPEELRVFFTSTFAERVAYWRELDRFYRPYVLPFWYEDQTDESMRLVGGLWIPDAELQQLVADAGHHLIHYALDQDLESTAEKMGLYLSPPFHRKILDVSGDVPKIDRYNMFLFEGTLREQVESDYGVRFIGAP